MSGRTAREASVGMGSRGQRSLFLMEEDPIEVTIEQAGVQGTLSDPRRAVILMPRLSRYLSIIRLFSEQKSMWTIPEISAAIDVPSSTVYRIVRELSSSSLLEAAFEGRYRLGAAFVEFDRRARLADPLVQVFAPILSDLIRQAAIPCVAVLARLYGDTVMCVADLRSADCSITTSYERGRPRPLTQGATSKAILAQLTSRRLAKLLSSASAMSANEDSKDAFRRELSRIRQSGFAVSHGEVDTGIVGIAVPVPFTRQAIVASLSLVMSENYFDESVERRLVLLLLSSVWLAQHQFERRESNKSGGNSMESIKAHG